MLRFVLFCLFFNFRLSVRFRPHSQNTPKHAGALSHAKDDDVEKILQSYCSGNNAGEGEVPFIPARVVLQDFTGVPAVVHLADLACACAWAWAF